MISRSPLRTFFEQELNTSGEAVPKPGVEMSISTEHVVSHLVEQTVHRAALDAVTQRYFVEDSSDEAAQVSWKHCLMVAALAELRPVKLLARS